MASLFHSAATALPPTGQLHRDACAVALADDAAHEGGRLLAVLDDGARLLSRAEGEATFHPSSVLHAVSGVTAGACATRSCCSNWEVGPSEGAESGV